MKKLLFVGHDATATGAPIFLLNFIKWVKINYSEVEFDIILLDRGSLYQDYNNLAPTYVYNERIQLIVKIIHYCEKFNFIGKRKNDILNILPRSNTFKKIKSNQYDALFVNSFASAIIIPKLAKYFNCPIIYRAPELSLIAKFNCGEEAIKAAIPYVKHFIAVSNIVRKFYITELGITEEKITIIPGFTRFKNEHTESKQEIRLKLNISKDFFVVCGAGTVDWRKGIDSFIKIASLVKAKKSKKKILFIWIGGEKNSIYFKQAIFDVQKLDLNGMVFLLGQKNNISEYLRASDIFALTSREDPMPLSAIEAASLGLPIICYKNSNGISEFLNEETGICVDYLDENHFAGEIIKLSNNIALVASMSNNIQVQSSIFDQEIISKRIFDLISNCQGSRHQ